MSVPKPPSHAGYVGACIYESSVGVCCGQVIRVRRTMIPFGVRKCSDFREALPSAVDQPAAACLQVR